MISISMQILRRFQIKTIKAATKCNWDVKYIIAVTSYQYYVLLNMGNVFYLKFLLLQLN